jgi:hypothetical protein
MAASSLTRPAGLALASGALRARGVAARASRPARAIAMTTTSSSTSSTSSSVVSPGGGIGCRGGRASSSVALPTAVGGSTTATIAADEPSSTEQRYFSGMNGKALNAPPPSEFPTMADVLSKIPKRCFVKDTGKSLLYAAVSTAITVGLGVAAYAYLPMTLAFIPAWIAYAFVAGTAATGCWVVAHECGHGAFSENKFVQDVVGYVLHSALLVPYFSWQRSHAVHHSRTNHVMEGETHVPARINTPDSDVVFKLRALLGEGAKDGFRSIHWSPYDRVGVVNADP